MKSRLILFLSGVIIFFYPLILFFQFCNNNRSGNPESAILVSKNKFVGPEACRKCHAKEYDDWQKSDHFKSMMVADDSTVLGDFNDVSLNADGISSRFFKKDGKYFINTDGPDGKNHDYEVKYTFGYYPLQQYLVEFPGGRMQAPRESFDTEKKKWFHQYEGNTIEHGDWLHWTHQAQNWNSMCAVCHSTNLNRNYNESKDAYATTYDVINVSCESCHGAGKNHIDYINSDEYNKGNRKRGSYLLFYKGQNNHEQLRACVMCHSRRMEISPNRLPSHEVLDNYIPQLPLDEIYFADGQFKDEAYEYGSFTQSRMYHVGVKCSDCHQPHTGKIYFTGNELCRKCHEPKYDSPQHHFHKMAGDGAQCVNCHMPTRVYMGNDTRRDHSLRVPRPDLSLKYDVPNACNKCHTDKSSQWATEAVIKWYGSERKYHFADDLLPGSLLDEKSLSHLLRLIPDTSIPEIIRATALNYLEQVDIKKADAVIKCLDDSSALIRYSAISTLNHYPANVWLSKVISLLTDSVRAVRIGAADALSGLPPDLFNKTTPQYSAANNELITFLHNQSDFPSGCIMIANYYYKTGDYGKAERYYLRSLKLDSLANFSRLNLSSIYNAQQRNDEALAVLLQAEKIDPVNPRIAYNLALLYVELEQRTDAKKYFEKAISLQYDYDRLYYNYALFLEQEKNSTGTEKVFLNGLKRFPNSESLLYGLSVFYLNNGKRQFAIPFITRLKTIAPDNPDYQVLFR